MASCSFSAASSVVTGRQSAVRFNFRKQSSVPGRRSLVVRAEEEENKPSLSFKANDRAALGFTEQDSAGQTNIFAVEPKTYVEGSSADDGSNSSLYALGAFMFSATILAGGVTILSDNSVNNDLAAFKNLSEYQAEFTAELASAPSL
eukprot:CAMPEP_0177765616 /NCGR_PEP_ID=MMETSP0491_2-20121128/8086_1 /TAXON_ID=63592 /ORGANISM="Tetraselmis chuii, Strain PLY429" /LENGTH=146 /DNA_ID=CAMNT_0019281975 /DNA_START=74 /DNA_END=514 /DNA_ORIENTATION=-